MNVVTLIIITFMSMQTVLAYSDVVLTTDRIIENCGYVSETHYITTEDGYILTVHRIPYGINGNDKIKRPAVFIMHGLFHCSAEDVELGSDRGLGFLLAEAGFDVWLGNARGNGYSRNHTTLDIRTDAEKFFDFSWHEIGYYDLPACIDYILNINGDKSLHYVGTSQGTTAFFVLMSTKPEYNNKIKLASLMAPAAFMHKKSKSFFCVNKIDELLKFFEIYEVPFLNLFRHFALRFCNRFPGICYFIFEKLIGNKEDAKFNKHLIPVILSNVPSNVAIKQCVHYCQQMKSDQFSWFDYGISKNLKIYGTASPPPYNFSKISAPVALYYAKNDGTIPFEDSLKVVRALPNVVKDYLVPSERYTHISFGIARDVVEMVYSVLINVMKKH